jgi:SAM-dependent methyltransferase
LIELDQVREFYRLLTPDYHLIFADWHKSVLRQSEVLDRLLRNNLPSANSYAVLDCACGIGTQALGLAIRGHRVHGTDISSEAVERARREAKAFEIEITLGVADFRDLAEGVHGQFDAVIAFDNAIAHLQAEQDLESALRSMASKTAPQGLVAVSIRDYDGLVQSRPRASTPVVNEAGSSIAFQVWDWKSDGSGYRLNQFILHRQGDEWQTLTSVSDLRAWQRSEVSSAMTRAGFSDIRWYMPDESGFYQPIVIARGNFAANPDAGSTPR